MSQVQTNITLESDRTRFNRRIREKRSKGHSSRMIADYAANCPVPLDQLHDLTPEELAEARPLRVEVEKRAEQRREDGLEKDKDGKVVPAKIDYEAVKDIPAADDAHRTDLARMNQFLRRHEKDQLWGRDQFVCGELKRRATVYHEADPSKHFLEHCLQTVRENTKTEWEVLYEQHCEENKKRAEEEQKRIESLKPETLEELFDALAKHHVATVEIEFQDDDWDAHLGGSVSQVLDAAGEKIDLEELPDEDGYLGRALLEACGDKDTWGEYAGEAIIGDTFRPRYAHADDGSFFQGCQGTVTFNILERTISLQATATVETVVEEEREVKETWTVDKTKTEAA